MHNVIRSASIMRLLLATRGRGAQLSSFALRPTNARHFRSQFRCSLALCNTMIFVAARRSITNRRSMYRTCFAVVAADVTRVAEVVFPHDGTCRKSAITFATSERNLLLFMLFVAMYVLLRWVETIYHCARVNRRARFMNLPVLASEGDRWAHL